VLPFQRVYAFCYASRQEFGLLRIAHGVLAVVRALFRLVYNLLGQADTLTPVGTGNETRIMLCADAGFTYLSEVKPALPALRANGTKIVTIIYDLIPINSAIYCNPQFTAVFDAWVRFAISQSDGLICISDAVRKEVAEFLPQLSGPKPSASKIDYFHLGFELDLVNGQPVSQEMRERVFGDERPVFLMVGTIEPRKNHAFVLRAFESLWRNGKDYKLCFVGRDGWGSGELIARLNAHPERGNRLFVLSNVADADLQYAYKKAYGLICASLVEGFGLPIVEALAHGLPVLASDIPVFREIAGPVPAYFDPTDLHSLRAAIVEYSQGGRAAAQKRTADYSPLSWEKSADMLLTRLLQLADVEDKTATLRPLEARAPAEGMPGYARHTDVAARSKAL
jgi:alpha-1,2-rhamnosyltransferase